MKYYIIAGEASGDLHASNLIRALKELDPGATFRGWGGDLMEGQGVEIIRHYRDLAFMGFIEVVANLRTILKNIDFCKKDIVDWNPDAIILVDYPGFNLRIAGFGKQAGFRIIYYISPQVWAWKQSRVHKIKKVVDLMMVILPFEREFYNKFNFEVTYVGHPLLDAIEQDQNSAEEKPDNWKIQNGLDDRPIIALVPGSRKQEITTMLPIMAEVCSHFNEYQFVVAAAPAVPVSFYESLPVDKHIRFIHGQFYQILKHAKAALVTSGTATLETALFGVPEVVCYKGSNISFFIAKKLVKVKYISLVNLVMERAVVSELIQNELNLQNLKKELGLILNNQPHLEKLKNDYQELKTILGNAGASKAAANAVFLFMKISEKI